MPNYQDIAHFSMIAGVISLAWLGVVLTAFTLPGIWIAIAAAVGLQVWHASYLNTSLLSWWALGACVILGVIAELIEFAASAMGASQLGGSKKAAWASVLGAMVGALAGTLLIPIPVAGTILGAALGAGGAALATEKHLGEKTWKEASKVGAGAAAGRLIATLVKLAIAVVIALVLTVTVLV